MAVDITGFTVPSLGGRTLKEVIIDFSGLGALGLCGFLLDVEVVETFCVELGAEADASPAVVVSPSARRAERRRFAGVD